ncbi:MAG: hypothetical protein WA397_17485 [Roseiarcus sp.]
MTRPSGSAPPIMRFGQALEPRHRVRRRLRDLKLKVMSSMRAGIRYLEPVTLDTLTEVQKRVVSRAQRTVLAARKTIDSAIVAA